ncbi:AbrB/MazE/SpoVT family DNA-binding domain-containing protein [Candidatus Microgenomates bacterium]|nr:AbrB/MazE/SpoVT family DNA-binding domain-containing protein [Candidatus Microgenomates bacterium]
MLNIRKVLKVGNSLGPTFPKEFVDKHNIKPGDDIVVTHHNGSVTYSINVPKQTDYQTIEDSEFFGLVKEIDLKYKRALDKLANLS